MAPHNVDLDAYFARIGYDGSREPTLNVLRELVTRHSATITFENIDVLARRPIPLDLASLHRKLIEQHRGGYCYEQNTLFQWVLRALGFRETGLLARVRRGFPPGLIAPRAHMLLLVDLPEGQHVADVGFGGLTPTAPLALRTNIQQSTPNETYRFIAMEDEFLLQAHIAACWEDVYHFTLQPQLPIDYEAINWFTSTRPNAMFVENLIVTRPTVGVRYTLFNRHFTRRNANGSAERAVLRSREEYAEVLRNEFGLLLTGDDIAEVMKLVAKHDPDHPYGGQFA